MFRFLLCAIMALALAGQSEGRFLPGGPGLPGGAPWAPNPWNSGPWDNQWNSGGPWSNQWGGPWGNQWGGPWGSPQPGGCAAVMCPMIYDPVCGMDGQTYSNQCQISCTGVPILHDGPCLGGGGWPPLY